MIVSLDMGGNEGTLKKSIEGGKWMLIDTFLQKTISSISFLILARILAPEDFGIIAILFIVPNFLDLISEFRFDSALIQSKKDPLLYLNEVWSLNVIKSVVILAITFSFAPTIASFFHIEKAIWAIRLSGIFIVIANLSNAAQLFFFKNIDFKKVFFRDITASLTNAAVTISLALNYRSFWSLFFGIMAQYIAATISTYFLHEFRPRLTTKLAKLKELFSYSKWMYGQNIVNNAIPLIENSLIGRMVSASGIGLYSKAKSLASLPSAPLYNIINKITFPAYSRIQDAYDKIKDGFLKSLDLLFCVTVPFIALFWEAGHKLVLIFLGEKWIEIDALLKILILAITVNILSVLPTPILNAVGKPRTQFYINIINIISLVASFILLIPRYGAIGAAFGFLTASAMVLLISHSLLIKILNIKIINIIKPSIIPIIASLITLTLGKIALNSFVNIGNIAFMMLIAFLGLLYGLIVFLFGKLLKLGPYNTLKLILWEIIRH